MLSLRRTLLRVGIALPLILQLALAGPSAHPASAKQGEGTLSAALLFMLEPTHGRTLLSLDPDTLATVELGAATLGKVNRYTLFQLYPCD